MAPVAAVKSKMTMGKPTLTSHPTRNTAAIVLDNPVFSDESMTQAPSKRSQGFCLIPSPPGGTAPVSVAGRPAIPVNPQG
jgi:hypothetical protein